MAIQKRFSRLKFHVHELKEGESLVEKFPRLWNMPEVREFEHQSKEKILKYIVYLYDSGSDLFDEFEDLKDRKDAAAVEAGFSRNKSDEWPKYLQEIMDINGDTGSQVLPIILAYMKIQNNNVWRDLQVTEHEYDRLIRIRMRPLGGKDEGAEALKGAKLQEASDISLSRISLLKKQFYADNKDVEEAEKQIPPIKPENADEVIKMYKNVS